MNRRRYLAAVRVWTVPFLFLALGAFAQPTPRALLWRIAPAGGGTPSYVVGTVHSPDARAYAHAPVLLEALGRCSLVAGELDFAAVQTQLGGGLSALMLPGGSTLKDLYPKRHYRKVQAALRERAGALAPVMERIRPFYLLAVFGEGEQEGDSTRVLDQYIQDVARGKGIEVVGLERVQEQLAAVNDLPLDEQADMLYDLVTHEGRPEEMQRMLDDYAAQDLDALAASVSDNGVPARFGARLIAQRNGVMVQRMDSLMRTGRSCFFAVGAAHLPAADGLIAGLRARGYVVAPMPDLAALRRDPVGEER